MDRYIVTGTDTGMLYLFSAWLKHHRPEALVETVVSSRPADSIQIQRIGVGHIAVLKDPTAPAIASAVASGARAVVGLESSPGEAEAALNALSPGAPLFVPPAFVRLLADQPAPEGRFPPSRPAKPTSREREVLELLALGYSNRELADALLVSPNTVRTHMQSLSDKLGIHGRAHLAAYACGVRDAEEPRSAEPEIHQAS